MKKIITLTESELINLVKRVIEEQSSPSLPTEVKKRDTIKVKTKTVYGAEDTLTFMVVDVLKTHITVIALDDEASRYGFSETQGTKVAYDPAKMIIPDLGRIISVNNVPVVNASTPQNVVPPVKKPVVPKVANKGSNKIVFPTPKTSNKKSKYVLNF